MSSYKRVVWECPYLSKYVFNISIGGLLCSHKHTVFARSDATATIYFIVQFCAASIREQHLLNSVLSVKPLVIVRALRKASFIRLMKNCEVVTWFWSKPSSYLISCRFATKRYLHGTSNLFPSSFSSNDFMRWSPSVHQKMPNFSGQRAFLYLACILIWYCHSRHEVCSRPHVLLEYYPQLVFECGNYFVQHVWKCDNNSRAASDRANTHLIV